MTEWEQEKQLVDIAYQCIVEIQMNPWFKDKSIEEIIEWVHSQYKHFGWDVKSIGSSWGVLCGRCIKHYEGI